jgi:hypothetical protein
MNVRLWVAGTLALSAVGLAAAAPKFTSSWKAPDAAGTKFAGKKVAALVITSDLGLQMSGEEQLVRELSGRGMQGVATYRMAPREELASGERARPWFERAGIEGVIALRPVSAETHRTYSPSVWTTTSYSTLWGYYGYGWTGVYNPGGVREDTVLVVETLVYSVPLNKLLWAGVSTTTNPKQAPTFIKELVDAAAQEMRKQGLVK